MYLIKLLLPSPEREKLLSWPGKLPGSRKRRSACSGVHTAHVFPDESSGGVLPLGKGQGELILWSVYTQCVLSLNALTRHLQEALVKQQHQPLQHEDKPSSLGYRHLNIRSQGQMLKELCEREEGTSSKLSPGHSPTSPGGLNLGGPEGSRQADNRNRC